MGRITVLVGDDDALSREGIALLLARHDGIFVVGEAADTPQLLRLAEERQPDILLLDGKMADARGFEVLPKVHAKSPRTNVLILSRSVTEEYVAESLEYGAKGYLLKAANQKDLINAIRRVHAGEIWANRKVVAQVLEGLLREVGPGPLSESGAEQSLTAREREIAEGAARGKTNKEIASQLGISDKTVKTHMSNIFDKLKVRRRAQLPRHHLKRHTDR